MTYEEKARENGINLDTVEKAYNDVKADLNPSATENKEYCKAYEFHQKLAAMFEITE